MSSKNPEKSLQRSESHLFTSTAKDTIRELLRLSTKTKRMPFLKQENSATPIQLRFKELCAGFYPHTSVSEQETKVVSCAGVTFDFKSRMMAKKSWFGWPSEAERHDMAWSGERTPKSVPTKDLCPQYSEMSCQVLQKIPQSPASGNERTRVTVLLSGPP